MIAGSRILTEVLSILKNFKCNDISKKNNRHRTKTSVVNSDYQNVTNNSDKTNFKMTNFSHCKELHFLMFVCLYHVLFFRVAREDEYKCECFWNCQWHTFNWWFDVLWSWQRASISVRWLLMTPLLITIRRRSYRNRQRLSSLLTLGMLAARQRYTANMGSRDADWSPANLGV